MSPHDPSPDRLDNGDEGQDDADEHHGHGNDQKL